jgi:hypothetical protein
MCYNYVKILETELGYRLCCTNQTCAAQTGGILPQNCHFYRAACAAAAATSNSLAQ